MNKNGLYFCVNRIFFFGTSHKPNLFPRMMVLLRRYMHTFHCQNVCVMYTVHSICGRTSAICTLRFFSTDTHMSPLCCCCYYYGFVYKRSVTINNGALWSNKTSNEKRKITNTNEEQYQFNHLDHCWVCAMSLLSAIVSCVCHSK